MFKHSTKEAQRTSSHVSWQQLTANSAYKSTASRLSRKNAANYVE